MAIDQSFRIAVITTPDQANADWINQIANDPRVGWIDQSAALGGAVDLVRQNRPDVVIVDRAVNEAEQFIRQMYTDTPETIYLAISQEADMQTMRRLMLAAPAMS
ncbi:MAG: hypothetical protein HC822_25095 [Oscillochloris sp.]|nr:hypothetical protein [Oscillochloris sp.]